MARRRERLTPEQIAILSAVRDSWRQVGLSTHAADRAAAEAGVRDAYREARLCPPQRMIWLASPLQGLIAAAKFWRRDDDQIGDRIWKGVRDPNRFWRWRQIWRHVGAPISDEIEVKVGAHVWRSVLDQISDHVPGQITYNGGSQHFGMRQRAILGSQQIGWLSFHDAVNKTVGPSEVTPSLRGLMQVARSAGWWWPLKDIAILTDRPCETRRDAQDRLHSDDGPALSYRDGVSVYAWRGIRAPGWVIERPQEITPDLIDEEPNSEVRRVMVERYKRGEVISGAAAYYRDAVSEILDDDPRWGRLYRRQRANDGDLVLVQVPNATPEPDGSINEYWLQVHPECRPMTVAAGGSVSLGEPQKLTALNAIASTFGMTGEEYASLSVES